MQGQGVPEPSEASPIAGKPQYEWPSHDEIIAMLRKHGSRETVAAHIGCSAPGLDSRLGKYGLREQANRALREHKLEQNPHVPNPARSPKPSVKTTGDTAEIRGPETAGEVTLADADALMRSRGFDPAEWSIKSATVNEWEGPGADGETRTYHQLKVHLIRRVPIVLPTPAVHVPALTKSQKTCRAKGEPEYIVVEGDHQAPYFDPALDAAVCALVAELNPAEHIFLGDLVDLPTISKHADHPAAMAGVQECIDAGYHLLRRRSEAAPNSKRKLLKGNHCWRIEQELLLRAERMYGIAPAGETLPALSLRRLLHLDALKVEFVEHPLGWEHAEVELVPGPEGLVVRHGWLTGANTAGRSLDKRGRSLIVGHGHTREHAFKWDAGTGIERQALMLGTMSQARGEDFPHFAVCDNWLQGCAVVTRWPDGKWQAEHVRWDGEELTWRDKRWKP